jgi:chromosome partitioning protein
MHVISILSGSGGSAKTTVTSQLGFTLAKSGKKVLLIDLDPQANLEIYCGRPEMPPTLGSINIFSKEAADLPIGRDKSDLLDVLWGDIAMSEIQHEISAVRRRCEYLLSDYINKNLTSYDVILLDCPATLGKLCENAVVASTHILVPLVPTDKSLQNLNGLHNWLFTVVSECQLNPKPIMLGMIPTIYDKNSGTHRNCLPAMEANCKALGIDVLPTIPKWLDIENACGLGIPLENYKSSHPGNEVFQKLTKIIIQKLG